MRRLSRTIAFALPFSFAAMTLVVHAQSSAGALNNYLAPNLTSVPAFLSAALVAMVKIALPIITVFIVYSGFLFVTARGNSAKLEQAKMNFLYVIIGALLILGAWIFANIIGGTVSDVLGPTN